VALLTGILGGCSASVSVGGSGSSPTTSSASPTAADRKVSGAVAASGMVAFTAYTTFNGSIDKTCAAINRDKFVVALADFRVTKNEALAGLDNICAANAGQTVGKEAAANDLLGILLHKSDIGMNQACQASTSDEIATGAANALASKSHPELTKALFLAQLARNCGQ
jgi:hypothetical protein